MGVVAAIRGAATFQQPVAAIMPGQKRDMSDGKNSGQKRPETADKPEADEGRHVALVSDGRSVDRCGTCL